MTEIEVPLEAAQEHIQHHAMHAETPWLMWAALASAILAVFAAIAALLAGHHANEAMLEQIHSSDQWSYYQAKGIKASVAETRLEILQMNQKTVDAEKLNEKIQDYKKDQKEIEKKAQEAADESMQNLHVHETLAKSVTLFQISIAVIAIAVLSRRKPFFYVSLTFGFIGLFFFILGLSQRH